MFCFQQRHRLKIPRVQNAFQIPRVLPIDSCMSQRHKMLNGWHLGLQKTIFWLSKFSSEFSVVKFCILFALWENFHSLLAIFKNGTMEEKFFDQKKALGYMPSNCPNLCRRVCIFHQASSLSIFCLAVKSVYYYTDFGEFILLSSSCPNGFCWCCCLLLCCFLLSMLYNFFYLLAQCVGGGMES